MGPAARFHGLISSVTILIMFWVVSWANMNLANFTVNYPFLSGLSALVSLVGVYRSLALGISWILHRSIYVRKWIFGAYFLHGTWIGYFIGHAGDKRLIVELYDQDLDSLIQNGRSFTIQKAPHGHWVGGATNVDVRRGRLIYTYSNDIGTNSTTLEGITTFQFEREASHKTPNRLDGYAHDLNDSQRIVIHEEKASDDLLPWSNALDIAVTRFL